MRLRTVLLGSLLAVTAAPMAVDAAPLLLQSNWDEAAVVRSFRAVVGRNPQPWELRRYASLMDRYGWTEEDVRRDLAERSDYRKYSRTSALAEVDAVIRRAYLDVLDREPDPAGIRSYRRHMVEEGWSEREVREALRRSPEYQSGAWRNASADRIIRRAYQDILRREPDPEGLQAYRRAIVEDGWDEYDVRRALRTSDERRERIPSRVSMGAGDAREIVRRAYLNVLQREPDEAGLRDYGNRVVRDRWTQMDVERALRASDEYRTKFR